jgi:hypothetical protein
MSTPDPQLLYMILVLPSLFGLTLLGEGVSKVVHEERNGIVSMIFGFMFLGAVVFTYLFFSSYLTVRGGI